PRNAVGIFTSAVRKSLGFNSTSCCEFPLCFGWQPVMFSCHPAQPFAIGDGSIVTDIHHGMLFGLRKPWSLRHLSSCREAECSPLADRRFRFGNTKTRNAHLVCGLLIFISSIVAHHERSSLHRYHPGKIRHVN